MLFDRQLIELNRMRGMLEDKHTKNKSNIQFEMVKNNIKMSERKREKNEKEKENKLRD